ncbi:MAG: serine hydrolase domain-containing protein [Thermomicrobiales bacterium]
MLISRRRLLAVSGSGIAIGAAAAVTNGLAYAQDAATPVTTDLAEAVIEIAKRSLSDLNLKSVIVRVTIDSQELVTAAFGESTSGVPATTDMHFRNGSVAISYVATLLLRFVDQKLIGLDDTIDAWLPDLPDSNRVTLRMLANMTSGYPDYVQQADFIAACYADPFRQWLPDELIEYGVGKPRVFEPGANWDYAHTNYVILGLALEKIGGQPMDQMLREQILDPLGLTNTVSSSTPAISEPVLHSYSSERRGLLGIPDGTRFYEDSTFWNPSWTITHGAIQTTNIYDMTASAEAVGTGALLSPESHLAQIEPRLVGFGALLDGCPTCHPLTPQFNYGLGVFINGPWLFQNPFFSGYGAIAAYLPSKRIAIAVATTPGEAAFDDNGDLIGGGNLSMPIYREIGEMLAPDEAPPATGS